MEYTEVTLKFPYLREKNIVGLQFEDGTISQLDLLINQNNKIPIPVCWYECAADHLYAIGNITRYVEVDIMYQVGEVISFDMSNDMITMRVKEGCAEDISKYGRVLPRALVEKVNDGDDLAMRIKRLVGIDIVHNRGGYKE